MITDRRTRPRAAALDRVAVPRCGGFTLIEILMALALAAVVVAVAGSLFVLSLNIWRRGHELREAQALATGLVDLIARDVRNASQAPSVAIRPAIPVDEGEAVLAIALAAPAAGSDADWVLYRFVPARSQVLRELLAASSDGQFSTRESRVVGIGVVSITAEKVGDGVAVEVEVRRGRSTAQARAAATPRNP
jgi:prepilin-type N-terminal cleavage/methylation domain-containing protein